MVILHATHSEKLPVWTYCSLLNLELVDLNSELMEKPSNFGITLHTQFH